MKVLVVDDCGANAETLRVLLEVNGHDAHSVLSGAAAEEELAVNKYDVMICDYLMQSVSGIDVLRWCRRNGVKIPTIILSAVRQEKLETVRQNAICEHLGPVEVLGKPADPKLIVQTAEKMAEKVKEC